MLQSTCPKCGLDLQADPVADDWDDGECERCGLGYEWDIEYHGLRGLDIVQWKSEEE